MSGLAVHCDILWQNKIKQAREGCSRLWEPVEYVRIANKEPKCLQRNRLKCDLVLFSRRKQPIQFNTTFPKSFLCFVCLFGLICCWFFLTFQILSLGFRRRYQRDAFYLLPESFSSQKYCVVVVVVVETLSLMSVSQRAEDTDTNTNTNILQLNIHLKKDTGVSHAPHWLTRHPSWPLPLETPPSPPARAQSAWLHPPRPRVHLVANQEAAGDYQSSGASSCCCLCPCSDSAGLLCLQCVV